MSIKYSTNIRPSLVSFNQSTESSSFISNESMADRPESPTLPLDESPLDEEYYNKSNSRYPSTNTPLSSTMTLESSTPTRQLSNSMDPTRRQLQYPTSSISLQTSSQISIERPRYTKENATSPIPQPIHLTNQKSTTGSSSTSPQIHAHHPLNNNNNNNSKINSSSSHLRHMPSSSTFHKPNSSSKRSNYQLTDHAAAAIELSSSTIASNPPAPAAGMYWSRTITYGRVPSKPLRAHTANMIGEMMYVFGGCNQKTTFSHLYILDMDTLTWSRPRTFGDCPPPCRAHSCNVVEILEGKQKASYLYVFGGGDGPKYYNELYILNIDTLTWTKPQIKGDTVSPRRAHVTCLWNNKIVIVGGGNGTEALSDVFMLDISDPNELTWSKVVPEGAAPFARGYHTGNLVKDKLVIYGGSDGHDCFSDVYILDLSINKWIQVELDRSISRLSHTATQIGSYLFVIGGHDGVRYTNDVLLLNLVTMSWETRKIYGTPPLARGYHTAVLHDSRLFILGGYDGSNVFDDLYSLELSSCAYLPQITNFDIDV
ncbi:unnamed protein product [Cunninghamella echinulata]